MPEEMMNREQNYEVCDLVSREGEERRQRYLTHHLLMMIREAQREEIERKRVQEHHQKMKKIAHNVLVVLASANVVLALCELARAFARLLSLI